MLTMFAFQPRQLIRISRQVTAPIRFPRFFMTSPAPCPYLEGRTERKVFHRVERRLSADELNEALGRIGFRRSQTVAYRPSCLNCNACVSVRLVDQRVPALDIAATAVEAAR